MRPSPHRQSGVVLIVSLVFLVVLTLLGLSGMQEGVMQERMSGNTQELLSAFEAAESGLRDGEVEVRKTIRVTSPFSPNCSNGLCEPATAGNGVWADTSLVEWDMSDATLDTNTRTYGAATGASGLSNVKRQPAYIVERLAVVERGGSIVEGFGGPPAGEWYRVTAMGFGKTGKSRALVQSVIRK